MAGIDLTGKDPWGAIGSTKAGGILGDAAPVLGTIAGGGDWLSLGMSAISGIFGGAEQSAAGGSGSSALNTSGWVIGQGNAQGGELTNIVESSKKWPWYVWAAGALVAIAIIKKAA